MNDDSLARKLTIRSATSTQLPFLLLYHTGPSNFVKKLMKEALKHGFKLFEHSLRKIATNGASIFFFINSFDSHYLTESIMVSSEEEIFQHIGVPYVPPESR